MRGSLRVLVSASAAALVGLGALTGCSGGDTPAQESGTTTSSTSPAGEATASASPSAAGSVELPADSRWVTATKSGLRFAVPDDWASIDAEKVLAGESNPGVDQLLETMGVTQEQFAQSLAGMDLMVMGPMDGTFAPNVNVVPNVLSELPPAANLASELSSVGATPGTPSDETTPLGPATLVPYSLTNGQLDIKGRSIVVGGPNGFVTITVSHVDDKAADAVADTLLSTLGAT